MASAQILTIKRVILSTNYIIIINIIVVPVVVVVVVDDLIRVACGGIVISDLSNFNKLPTCVADTPRIWVGEESSSGVARWARWTQSQCRLSVSQLAGLGQRLDQLQKSANELLFINDKAMRDYPGERGRERLSDTSWISLAAQRIFASNGAWLGQRFGLTVY